MTSEDYEEILNEIKDMCESSIQMSQSGFIPDSVHKDGLVSTLEDIIKIIRETK